MLLWIWSFTSLSCVFVLLWLYLPLLFLSYWQVSQLWSVLSFFSAPSRHTAPIAVETAVRNHCDGSDTFTLGVNVYQSISILASLTCWLEKCAGERIQWLGQLLSLISFSVEKAPSVLEWDESLQFVSWKPIDSSGVVLAFLLPLFLDGENCFLLITCCIKCVCVKPTLNLAFLVTPCDNVWDDGSESQSSQCCCSCEGFLLSVPEFYALGWIGEFNREVMVASCLDHPTGPRSQQAPQGIASETSCLCISGFRYDCELWVVI